MFDYSIWDYWADKYEKLWVQKYSLGPTRREVISLIKRMISGKDRSYRILDVGCGTGQLLREIQKELTPKYDIQCKGIDISQKMIETAQMHDLETEYEVSSIEDYGDDSYDIVVCSHSFPYYMDKTLVLQKLHRLLNDKGCLILVQASQNNLYDHIIMSFVKMTTSKAQYPSVGKTLEMLRPGFPDVQVHKIKERFYMPSICMFVCRKGNRFNGVGSYENFTGKTQT